METNTKKDKTTMKHSKLMVVLSIGTILYAIYRLFIGEDLISPYVGMVLLASIILFINFSLYMLLRIKNKKL